MGKKQRSSKNTTAAKKDARNKKVEAEDIASIAPAANDDYEKSKQAEKSDELLFEQTAAELEQDLMKMTRDPTPSPPPEPADVHQPTNKNSHENMHKNVHTQEHTPSDADDYSLAEAHAPSLSAYEALKSELEKNEEVSDDSESEYSEEEVEEEVEQLTEWFPPDLGWKIVNHDAVVVTDVTVNDMSVTMRESSHPEGFI